MSGGRKSKTWRDLKSAKKPAATVSWRARLRFAAKVFNRLFALAAAAGAGYLAWRVYDDGLVEKALAPATEDLRLIEYKTDGAITKSWLAARGLFPRIQNLAEIDIIALRENFEKVGQIRKAEITKIYPDKIRIEVSEYVPAARVAIARGRVLKEYALSREGVFFESVCIPRESLMELPWVIGVPIVEIGGEIAPYSYAFKIDELVKAAREALPEHYKTWRTVNVRELGSATLPIILVTTSENMKILFSAHALEAQLEKLEYVLKYMRENGIDNIEKIDLSLSRKAVASPRESSK